MPFLFLFVLCSVVFLQAVRFAQHRGHDMLSIITVNYMVAFLVTAGIFVLRGGGWGDSSPWISLRLGLFNGFLFIVTFPLLLACLSNAGVGVTSASIRIACLAPVIVSWLAWGESMNPYRWAAVALLPVAMVLIRPRDPFRPNFTAKADVCLLAMFLLNGLIQTTHKFAEISLVPAQQEVYKTALFGTAATLGSAALLLRGRLPELEGVKISVFIGVFNAATLFAAIMAMDQIPAVILFPTGSSLIIALHVIISWRLWKETLLGRQIGGLLLALAVVFLVNVK